MKQPHSRFSWRNDPDVPTFSDTGPRAVMDAHCAICARGARWIARNDKKGEFRIIPVQSELGRALMIHHGIDPEDPLSWLYLEDGHGYESVEAMIRTGQRLGGIWRAMLLLRVFPRAIQDYFYGLLARNRYRLGGHTDLCSLPDPQVQARLMT